jgi:tRNA dimethylallyltransferase
MMKRKFLGALDEWSGEGVLSLMGPTGSGKTSSLIAYLARQNWQKQPLLVSIDAVAVYRRLDIGSAKPLGTERAHHEWVGLDIKNPDEPCTVRNFLDAVEESIAEALEVHRPVVLVGGSGFYEKALVEGQAPGAASDPDFQKSLEALSNEALHRRLSGFDGRWAQFIHLNDRYRLTRYLDLVERQGFLWQDLRETQHRSPRLRKLWSETSCVILGLDWPRETYVERLQARVRGMWVQGWLEEVRRLLKDYSAESPGLQTMGYKEIAERVSSGSDLGPSDQERLQSQILAAHVHYVKRQKTWLRRLQSGQST